jgi:hypothetical protein
MSVGRLNTSAPSYGWSKTGVNVYASADGAVEASVVHHSGYSELIFRWSSGLVVEGWVRDGEEDADAWRATLGEGFIDVHAMPLLPHGTAETVWGIFVLIKIAGRKTGLTSGSA